MHDSAMDTAGSRLLRISLPLVFAAAQAHGQASVPSRVTLNGALLRPSVDTFYEVERTDTTAVLIQSLALVIHGGQPAWLQVYTARGSSYAVVDSIEMDGRTLLTIVEVRHTGTGTVSRRYDGATVRETLRPKGAAARTSARVFPTAIYSSSVLDAIARALPLDRMAEVLVAMYYPFLAKVDTRLSFYALAGSSVVLDRHCLATHAGASTSPLRACRGEHASISARRSERSWNSERVVE